jgi:hypothetical protein
MCHSTLRCIAERLLPEGHRGTYLQREMVNEKVVCPPATKRYHIYCSPNNPGALKLLEEFADNHGLTLKLAPSRHAPLRRRSNARFDRRKEKRANMHNATLHVTLDIEMLGECDVMLVYLTAETWTRADASSMFGSEVGRAMDADVPLLLVHEMIGVGGQETRHGCEFSTFFSCDAGATPTELLQRGIYSKIAVAIKGGEWRKTSMAMLAKAIAGSDAVVKEDADELKSTQAMSKAVQQELRIFAVTHAAASMTARGRAAASSAALSLGEIIISRLSSSKWSLSGVGGQRETPATADAADVQSSV